MCASSAPAPRPAQTSLMRAADSSGLSLRISLSSSRSSRLWVAASVLRGVATELAGKSSQRQSTAHRSAG